MTAIDLREALEKIKFERDGGQEVKLHQFELAALCNLAPEEAKEAFALVPWVLLWLLLCVLAALHLHLALLAPRSLKKRFLEEEVEEILGVIESHSAGLLA